MEGVTDAQARQMATNLEFKGAALEEATNQIKNLYEMFCKVDATQVEINPFGETPDGQGIPLSPHPLSLRSLVPLSPPSLL